MSANSENCDNCGVVLTWSVSSQRKFVFTSQMRNVGVKISDALQVVFPLAPFESGLALHDKKICRKCVDILERIYTQLAAFKSASKQDSFCYAHYIARSTVSVPKLAIATQTSEDEVPEAPSVGTQTHVDALPTAKSNRETQTKLTISMLKLAMKKTPIGKKMSRAKAGAKHVSFYKSIRRMVNDEIQNASKKTSMRKNPDKENILPPIALTEAEIERECPMVLAVLRGLCLKKKSNMFTPSMLTIYAICVNQQSQICNLFQKCIGLILWKTKASKQTYDLFRNFGLSVSYITVIRTLDQLRVGYDSKILKWKSMTSAALQHNSMGVVKWDHDYTDPLRPIPAIRPTIIAKRKLDFDEKFPTDEFYGLSFTFDNLNKLIHPGEYSSRNQTKILNVVTGAAVFNRVSSKASLLKIAPVTLNASDLPAYAFLPSEADILRIREDHKVLIKRILVKGLSYFFRLESRQIWNIHHDYFDQSKLKSTTVPLGVIPEDENTTEGMHRILERFQKYLPEDTQGRTLPCLAWGDGLTADRVKAAQDHRVNSRTDQPKFKEIFPGVSMWHKRVLLLTDDIKALQKSNELSTGKGSLPNLRSRFGHSQASIDVKTRFNPTFKFLTFCLHSYVIALARFFLEFERVGEKFEPEVFTFNELELELNKVVESILDFEWHDIEKAVKQERYCICQIPLERKVKPDHVKCINDECDLFVWYHRKCVEEALRKDNCTFLPLPTKTGEIWACSASCKLKTDDRIAQYSRAVIFAGLNHAGFRDAIRQNDGYRMNSYNKMHLIQLFNKHHTNYTRICHRVQCYVSGCAPPNIIHDILHNSTVNVNGGPGRNISLDLYTEFLNKFMKDNLLAAHGNLSKQSIERRSQAMGIVKDVEESLEEALRGEQYDSRHSRDYELWREDLQQSAEILLSHGVFRHTTVRSHNGFEDFNFDHVFIKDKHIYMNNILRLSKTFDNLKRLADIKCVPSSVPT